MPAQFRIPFLARTGRNGDITVGQVVLAAGKFNTNVEGVDIECRNFALLNAGFAYSVTGQLKLGFSFDGCWNFRANPANPPRIVPGDSIDDVKLWLRRGLEKYTIPEAGVTTGATNVEMDALINYQANGVARGGWLYPGDIQAIPPEV